MLPSMDTPSQKFAYKPVSVTCIYIYDVVIYLDFHSRKRALCMVDSWSRAPDQIQMYPDRDTIPQLLPSQLFVC